MKKQYIIIPFIFIFCLFLTACKQETIDFHHESEAQKLLDEFGLKKDEHPTIKKTKGVIIYKDNTTVNKATENVKFGPKDLNFEIKF